MTRSSYPKIARQEKTSMEQEEPEQNGFGEGLHTMPQVPSGKALAASAIFTGF